MPGYDGESAASAGSEPSAPRSRPILFSAPMVRALLAGSKTQTRRIVKPQPQPNSGIGLAPLAPYSAPGGGWTWTLAETGHGVSDHAFSCPYGVPGDTLWVREAHYLTDNGDEEYAVFAADPEDVGAHLAALAGLRAHHPSANWDRHAKLRPSIHMPRWASRITLQITDVRVERLNEISEADALAEGTQEPSLVPVIGGAAWSERDVYARLWEVINGEGSWAANPWVWAVSFEVINPAVGASPTERPALPGDDQ